MPEAIIAFLDSNSYEDALRNAVSLGGDSDTQACIAGAVAEAHYKDIPTEFLRQIRTHLTEDLWDTTLRFYRRYGIAPILAHVEAPDPS